MDSRKQEENRADLGRVLLALVVLALLASFDNSRAPADTVAQAATEASR
jgi:hypothetical protein